MYAQKRKELSERGEPKRTERELRARLAAASGGTLFPGGPGAAVTDQFRQGFDLLGRSRTEQRLGASGEEAEPEARETGEQRPEAVPSGTEPQSGRELSKGIPSKPLPLQRFSEVAFRRGNLSGAILQGTGKMMLVSCLRRTVNPRRPLPHEELGPWEKRLPFSGHDPDTQVFVRDLARGAVSIVVDTLHDAHRTLELLQEAVESGGPGAEQLFALYPFLDESGERSLLASCRAGLPEAAGPDERAMLQNALVHAEASLANKARMRMDFLASLRRLGEQARQAIEEFEEPDFAESVAAAVLEDEQEPPPPPENPPGDGGAEESADEAEYAGAGWENPDGASEGADGPDPGAGA